MMLFPEIDGPEEAVRFLKDNLAGKGEIFVAFSGGKDSICCAELMRMSGLPYRLFYSFTGIEPPEVVRFIRKHYSECVFLKQKRTFWQYLAVMCPPSNNIRWCCHLFKKEISWSLPHKHRVMGIRTEESWKRADYNRIDPHRKRQDIAYYPIFHWKEFQVWDFIESNQLPYPSLYDEGFDRIGCIICPYHSGSNGKLHQKYRDRWPKYFEIWEREIAKLYEKRKAQGAIMGYPSPQEFCAAWYKNKQAIWQIQPAPRKKT